MASVNRSHPAGKSLRYWWTGRRYSGTRSLAELSGGFRVAASAGASVDGAGPTPGVRSLRHATGTACLANFDASAPSALTHATFLALYRPAGAPVELSPVLLSRGPDAGLAMSGQVTGDLTYLWPPGSEAYSSTGLIHEAGAWNLAAVTVEPTRAVVRLKAPSGGWQEWENVRAHGAVDLRGGFIGLGHELYDRRTPGLFSDLMVWDRALSADEIKSVHRELMSGCPGLLLGPGVYRDLLPAPAGPSYWFASAHGPSLGGDTIMRKSGLTGQSTEVRFLDAVGAPVTTVTSATAGLSLHYRRRGSATVDFAPAALGSAVAAWVAGGIIHLGDGYYRVDYPDAAGAAGAPGVLLFASAPGLYCVPTLIPLVSYDPLDASALGLTSLDAAISTRATNVGVWSQPRDLDPDDGTYAELFVGWDGEAAGPGPGLNTINLGPNAPAADITDQGIRITSGPGSGQARRVVSYAAPIATVHLPWGTAVAAGSKWALTEPPPGGPVASVTAPVSVAGTVVAALVDGTITSAKFAVGTVNGAATGILERLSLLLFRFFPPAGGLTRSPLEGDGELTIETSSAVISTQAVTNDGTEETIGPPSVPAP